MKGPTPVVLVADEGPEGWQESLCRPDGRITATAPRGRWASYDRTALSAEVVLSSTVEACEYPRVETLLPHPIVTLPRRLSLAAFAPDDWARFVVVDSTPGCGLVTRSEAGRFHYAESSACDAARAAREFGFRRAVSAGGQTEGFDAVERVAGDDWMRLGAARLAVAALRSDGVLREHAEGAPTLRLARKDSAAYDVIHTSGVFDPANDMLAGLLAGRPALLAMDATVATLYGARIREYARKRLGRCGTATVRPGDARKQWPQVAALCDRARRMSLPRDGVIVGIGGGVTLDIAGLAASLYRRGTPYLRVPTTLLGMVDVAVGIKQAINFKGKKSLLGAFYGAEGAVNDLTLLATLPRTELANGFSEIIKVGLARDGELFEWVEKHGPRLVQSGYRDPAGWGRRIALRAEYVMMADLQPNLYEQDRARFPDFGHTFSTAIEEATEYELPHGAAVAADMLLSTILAARRGICGAEVLDRLIGVYEELGLLGLPESCTAPVLERGLEGARMHRGGHIHMVVPKSIGEACFLEDVTTDEARAALERAVAICASPRRVYARAGD